MIQKAPFFTYAHSTIYNGQDMGATYVPIDRWMDKEDIW